MDGTNTNTGPRPIASPARPPARSVGSSPSSPLFTRVPLLMPSPLNPSSPLGITGSPGSMARRSIPSPSHKSRRPSYGLHRASLSHTGHSNASPNSPRASSPLAYFAAPPSPSCSTMTDGFSDTSSLASAASIPRTPSIPLHGSPLRLAITNVHTPGHYGNVNINGTMPDMSLPLASSPMQDISDLMHKPACVLSAVPRKTFPGTGNVIGGGSAGYGAKSNGLTIRTTGFTPALAPGSSGAPAPGSTSTDSYFGLATGSANDLRPACIKRRPDLGEIPASPPVFDPAYLLGNGASFDMSPNALFSGHVIPTIGMDVQGNANANAIANANVHADFTSLPSPTSMSPRIPRSAVMRRPSALANELRSMHVDDVAMRE